MKAQKGTVTVEACNGRLRLRLPRQLFQGTQKRINLQLPDTAINRQIANHKASEIETDLALDRFDDSLKKYKFSYTPHLPYFNYEIIELWDRYAEAEKLRLSVTTITKDFRKVRNHILKFPSDCKQISQAKKVRKWLMENLTLDTARRVFNYIKACCDWAVAEEMLESNPFDNLSVKTRKKQSEIHPFTNAEREMIINAFADSHYLNFVKFLFWTGCRTSEAVGLTWGDIDPAVNKITFRQAVVERNRKETKTYKVRVFPVNDQLKKLLLEIKPKNFSLEQPVFDSVEGCLVDAHNFLERHWKPKLKGLAIAYRPQYNTRHTFITHCLEQGIPVNQIAQWVGNSPKTIWQFYAGLVSTSKVPSF